MVDIYDEDVINTDDTLDLRVLDGVIYLVVVDSDGEVISYLTSIEADGFHLQANADNPIVKTTRDSGFVCVERV